MPATLPKLPKYFPDLQGENRWRTPNAGWYLNDLDSKSRSEKTVKHTINCKWKIEISCMSIHFFDRDGSIPLFDFFKSLVKSIKNADRFEMKGGHFYIDGGCKLTLLNSNWGRLGWLSGCSCHLFRATWGRHEDIKGNMKLLKTRWVSKQVTRSGGTK